MVYFVRWMAYYQGEPLMNFFFNLFNGLYSQINISTIASAVTIICAVAGLIVYIRHHQAPTNEKWKTVGITSLVVVLVVALLLRPILSKSSSLGISSQRHTNSQWNLVYTYYNNKNPDEFGLWDMAWSPDSTRIASADAAGAVRIWDATTGRPYLHHVIPTPRWYGITVA